MWYSLHMHGRELRRVKFGAGDQLADDNQGCINALSAVGRCAGSVFSSSSKKSTKAESVPAGSCDAIDDCAGCSTEMFPFASRSHMSYPRV